MATMSLSNMNWLLAIPDLLCYYAGLTGLVLAESILTYMGTSPMKNLRNMNMYVKAALQDWHKNCHLDALNPFEVSPSVTNDTMQHANEIVAGTSSFGMSGVNASAFIKKIPSTNHPHTKSSWVSPQQP